MKLNYLTKYIYYLIVTVTILSLGMTTWFLYDNFYRTLIQAKVIYVLRNQVTFEAIDINLWNKILQKFQDKKISQIKEDTKIPDPFSELVEVVEIKEE